MKIEISVGDLNYILTALQEKPYREVHALVQDLLEQGNAPTVEDEKNAHLRAVMEAPPVAADNNRLLAEAVDHPPSAGGLSLWQCHKKAWAEKIVSWTPLTFHDEYVLLLGGGSGYILTGGTFRDRFFKDGDKDLGYLVVYADGYASWSPTKAFEEGYTRIEQ